MYYFDYFFSRENLFCLQYVIKTLPESIFNDNAFWRKKNHLTQCFVYMKYMYSRVYINWNTHGLRACQLDRGKKEQRFADACVWLVQDIRLILALFNISYISFHCYEYYHSVKLSSTPAANILNDLAIVLCPFTTSRQIESPLKWGGRGGQCGGGVWS